MGAAGSSLERGAVDAEFRREERLGPDGILHLAHAHVKAVGMVEEIQTS
jgi:hypothetical protein